MSSAQVQISQLPTAGTITGDELVPIVQNGLTVQTTTGAISASPSQTQTFITVDQEPTLANSRALSAGTGVTLTDGGAQAALQIGLSGAAASLNAAGTGIVAKTSSTAVAARSIASGTSGLSVANGDGVSGNPTISLTGQVLSLANASGAGLVALPNNGTVTPVEITGTASEIVVANGTGAAGNPTIGIADNPALPGAEGVLIPAGTTGERPVSATNGILRYNSTTQTFEGYANSVWGAITTGTGVTSVGLVMPSDFTVTNSPVTSAGDLTAAWASQTTNKVFAAPNGSTGTPTFRALVNADLPDSGVTATTYGSASVVPVFAVNAKGVITSVTDTNIAISNAQVSGLGTMSTQNASSVAITGGTINNATIGATTPAAGTFTSATLTTGTISTTPSASTDIVNKSYVDNIVASGVTYHTPVYVEVPDTTGNLNATYNNGTAGVGATLTNAGTQVALTIDGVLMTVGKRVLVYNQTNATQNGVYTVTTVGDGSTNWVMTRATDADTYGLKDPDALGQGDAFYVQAGDTGAGETYVCTTSGTITFGTTAITFAQISAAQVYSAGTGLTLTGTQFSITNTAVTSGSYGGAATVPTYSVNAQGQLTAAANVSIAIAASQITSGTLPTTYGGTGLSSFTAGDITYYASGTALSKLPIGTSTYILTSSGTAPQYTDPASITVGAATTAGSATTATTATNLAGGIASQIPYQTGASATSFIANGTAGQVLISAGTGAPTWGDINGGTF